MKIKITISFPSFSSNCKLYFLTLQFLSFDKSFKAGTIDCYKVSTPITFVIKLKFLNRLVFTSEFSSLSN